MRYLGIDYGHKKVGLAISDEQGDFVYPHSVIANTPNLQKELISICQKEGIGAIVFGESLDLKGQANPILAATKNFADNLGETTKLPIYFQNEIYTSREAARLSGQDKDTDARAAAIILQSYLDLKKNK